MRDGCRSDTRDCRHAGQAPAGGLCLFQVSAPVTCLLLLALTAFAAACFGTTNAIAQISAADRFKASEAIYPPWQAGMNHPSQPAKAKMSGSGHFFTLWAKAERVWWSLSSGQNCCVAANWRSVPEIPTHEPETTASFIAACGSGRSTSF